jgi:predicted NAD-dependent protein-ADP-ribosyltransferase YbiA (DUF1768 family)
MNNNQMHAFNTAHNYRRFERPNWLDVRLNIMKEIVKNKFEQN